MSQMNSHKTVEGIARIGIDLAKSVFHLAAMDSRGRLLLQKTVHEIRPAGISQAHQAVSGGHGSVRGSSSSGREDAGHGFRCPLDGSATPEALREVQQEWPSGRGSHPPSGWAPCHALSAAEGSRATGTQQIHRIRSMAVAGGVAKASQIRSFLLESGIAIPQGRRVLMRELPGLLDREDIDLPPSMRPRIRELLEELWQPASRIVEERREESGRRDRGGERRLPASHDHSGCWTLGRDGLGHET